MTGGLAPPERRALLAGSLYRILGTPVVAGLGLVNTSIIAHETGPAVFGLVALVATVALLFPFADLGIGATVLSASAQLAGPARHPDAVNVIRRAYHVLLAVAAALVALALVIMILDGWTVLVGFSSGPQDRWAITVAACLWAVSIPAGLGVRILIGIDRNPLATLVLMSCPAFALAVTAVLAVSRVDGIWYAVSALAGLVLGQVLGTVLALRISGLGTTVFGRVTHNPGRDRLLAGSLWLFLVGAGTAVGLQAGRVILAHLSTPEQLSQYALAAQLYAACWSVVSTAGLAYWPIFVKRRSATEETVRLWRTLTTVLGGCAAVAAVGLWALGPWAAGVLSGGQITVSSWLALAFGALLIGQAVHLPANVLLTRPDEARWQARWTLAMAVVSIAVGCLVAPWGALAVVSAAVLATVVAQVIPDLVWVPRLVRRRPGGG
jgi:O-antigen/teichoic acid export membrane protein